MNGSKKANAIFISDPAGGPAERFARLRDRLEAEYPVIIHRVRIRGQRWEFAEGRNLSDSVTARGNLTFPSSPGRNPSDSVTARGNLTFPSSPGCRLEGPIDLHPRRLAVDEATGLVIYGWDKLEPAAQRELGKACLGLVQPEDLTREQIIDYLKAGDPEALFRRSDAVREKYCGPEVHLRGIIEFSNYCARDCTYCGLRKSNARLQRYRMEFEEIIDSAQKARDLDYKTVVLQSGEDEHYGIEELCRIVEAIKKRTACAVTLSVGERSYEDYRRLKEAGADRYLLKFETSDKVLFRKLKPDSSYEARFQCLAWLKQLGFQVGSGNMVGLPGQTPESLAGDILLMKELDLDMASTGPFIPHPDTPLAGAKPGDLETVLKAVALTRIATRNAHIPATTSTGSIHPEGRQMALVRGANVIMPNVTPQKYRRFYEIYPNKICVTEKPEDCGACVAGMIWSVGRAVAKGYGHSLKKGD